MRKRREKPAVADHEQMETPQEVAPGAEADPAADALPGEEGPGDTAAATIQRLSQEHEELKDKYLRLAADFDNFRKRAARERGETWARAQAAVVTHLLEALDDLARVAAVDAQQTTAEDVVAGVRLVERKMLRELENAGLKKVGTEGDTFDPNHHEAVSALPAPSTDQHQQVAAVLQAGYRFNGALLRPAKVQVFVESDEPNE